MQRLFRSGPRGTALLLAALLGACGSPPAPTLAREVREAPGPRVAAETPHAEAVDAIPTLDEALTHARTALDGRTLLAEHREPIDGEARVHLVLEHGRCYRLWVGADGRAEARLLDEHGQTVASALLERAAWLPDVCPRWSGSFELALVPAAGARELGVLVTARPLDPP